jgi:serine/threonine-protein kinase
MSANKDREGPPFHASGDAPTRKAALATATARICRSCGHVRAARDTPCDHCGTGEPPDTRPLIVDGRYEVVSELGHGGMGIVYLAEDAGLGRGVALKMIAPRWLGDDAILAGFQREAKALASIRSQYVVQVHAFGLHEGAYFFAMEYVRGRTLRRIVVEHREHHDTVPVHRSLTILHRIAQGIDAVHAAGIVHRDVKPSNVVIEEDTGRPVLVDFGLAVPSADPESALAIGTPQYMAPEQAGVGTLGASVTPRTDVYSLGIVAFEMLTGRLPFDSDDVAQLVRQHARKKPPALSSILRTLAPFDKAVARALAKDPAERYPSCTAFAEVLAAAGERWITSTLPTLPPPPPEGEPPSQIAPAKRSDRPGLAATRPFHALVVDDSPVFRRFTVQATQLALFRHDKDRRVVVEGAGSGQEAIERAAAVPPDLVLLDFDMPGLDGVDTLSRLRALPGGGRARVVVLSGRVGAADRWRFAVLGVNHFVAKPIDFRQLVDRIEAIARRFEETDRLRAG